MMADRPAQTAAWGNQEVLGEEQEFLETVLTRNALRSSPARNSLTLPGVLLLVLLELLGLIRESQ